jgi:ribosomal protein L13
MSNRLWIAQRFLKNERGHYTVRGDCGTETIMVEIDPAVVAGPDEQPERRLLKMRAQIQAAARHKWEAGEAYPVYHSHSGRMKHQAIALTAADLIG